METKDTYTIIKQADSPRLPKLRYSNRTDKLKLYAEFIRLQVAAFAILYQIITDVKPPKLKELLQR